MAQTSGVVTLRTGNTFQLIPRSEIRQVEVLDNATVKWWLAGDENPFSWQFFDEEGDQAPSIAEQFYADIAPRGVAGRDFHLESEWIRVSDDDDDGEAWTRNGKPVVVEGDA